jgi:hypothetical protein
MDKKEKRLFQNVNETAVFLFSIFYSILSSKSNGAAP